LAKLDKLAAPFFAGLQRTFGARSFQVVANMLGSGLAHSLADLGAAGGNEDFYAEETLNTWLRAAQVNHGISPWQLVIEPRDCAEEHGGEVPDEHLARLN
jgi:hypothetical protein